MPAKDALDWYGTRTLFRLVATGKRNGPTKYYDANSTLVEDRIVLFRAKSFKDAIRQAEAEAKHYCKTTRFDNIYGQRGAPEVPSGNRCISNLHRRPASQPIGNLFKNRDCSEIGSRFH